MDEGGGGGKEGRTGGSLELRRAVEVEWVWKQTIEDKSMEDKSGGVGEKRAGGWRGWRCCRVSSTWTHSEQLCVQKRERGREGEKIMMVKVRDKLKGEAKKGPNGKKVDGWKRVEGMDGGYNSGAINRAGVLPSRLRGCVCLCGVWGRLGEDTVGQL